MLQLVLLAALVWVPGPRVWLAPGWLAAIALAALAGAALLALAGAGQLGTGLTASPLPNPSAELRTTGVYGWVRHPIYTALLVGGAAVVVFGGRLNQVAVWLVLLALLLVKATIEEAALTVRFPDYRRYRAVTGRLLPRPRRPVDRPAHRPGGVPGGRARTQNRKPGHRQSDR
jgi:protein-S-isoprenylcysteine O-methyltransferase Ste14